MLFTTDGVDACLLYGGFLLAPLPAKKQLWQARDSLSWHVEKKREGASDDVSGIKIGGLMARFRQVVETREIQAVMVLAHLQEPTESESDAHWTDWCLGMDGLGALVMLAALLRAE